MPAFFGQNPANARQCAMSRFDGTKRAPSPADCEAMVSFVRQRGPGQALAKLKSARTDPIEPIRSIAARSLVGLRRPAQRHLGSPRTQPRCAQAPTRKPWAARALKRAAWDA